MRIGIDASRATLQQRTGTEGYSLHVIRGILTAGVEHDFILYFRDLPPDGLFPEQDNVSYRVIPATRFWTHSSLRKAVISDKPDVLFVPAHVLPWPGVRGVTAVVTIHDLGYKHFPDKHPLGERLYLNWSTRHSARSARRIIVHSNATAHDLISLENVPDEKIKVIYPGVDPSLGPATGEEIARVTEKYQITHPYILHIGRMEPRKNLSRLLEAYSIVRAQIPNCSLVFAGRYNEKYHTFKKVMERLDNQANVHLTGYIPDEDKAALYSGASVYIFPSLYEGFGFPALEAMACGVPVICSNTSSLPELVADAALTIAPTDTAGMAKAIIKVLTDDGYAKDLVKKGMKRVSQFSWENCSRETLETLLKAKILD